MPAAVEQHHHRNTTKVTHKPFKPRFTSKNALKDRAKGKVEALEARPRKTRHQEVMSKFDRKNQAKQKRNTKHQDHVQTTGIFTGRDGAPRIVAVVPLCHDASARLAAQSLNRCIDLDDEVLEEGNSRVNIDRFKQKLQYITVRKDLMSAMDACRAADYVLLVLSATEEVDEVGEAIIRCIEGQGISQVYTVVQHLDAIDQPKKRNQTLTSLKSFITHFFPTQEKLFSLDSPQECQNLMRSLCTTTPKGIKWRENRSWLLADNVIWEPVTNTAPSNGLQSSTATAIFTGTVRGRNFRADRLVQIGDLGAYQVEKVVATPLEQAPKRKDTMILETTSADIPLDRPTEDQETLEELAPEEAVMQDFDVGAMSTVASERKGVLLDDQHLFEPPEEEDDAPKPKRLPRGTSNYQSAWYLGDISDSGSDVSDMDEDYYDAAMTDLSSPDFDDGPPRVGPSFNPDNATPSEYPATEAFNDLSPHDAAEARELSAYRASRKNEDAAEDLAFPDEIELEPTVLARERLARYRGLKSAKTSPWLTEEDTPFQPADWPRLLEISDYKAAKSRVLRETLVGGVKAGTRVSIYLRDVPLNLLQAYDPARPLVAYSLLRHEHKRTAVDVSITLSSDYPEPIKSKEELIVQIGLRRFTINPLFSQAGNTPNDVHKFERWLHPGRTAVASWVGPLTWGAVPVLFFKRAVRGKQKLTVGMEIDAPAENATPLQLIAHGTVLPTSSSARSSSTTSPGTSRSRIIAKRLILTGQPYKINKRITSIRYMFFDKGDVEWFKALPLFTNHGQRGSIKESLGTHGHFKAVFEGKVSVMDAVGVALWKRVWPRNASSWRLESDEKRMEEEVPTLVGAA